MEKNILHFFHISYVNTVGFELLKPNIWLEVLITDSLSFEIFSASGRTGLVARSRCLSSPLN
jgi:hypothetical protein